MWNNVEKEDLKFKKGPVEGEKGLVLIPKGRGH